MIAATKKGGAMGIQDRDYWRERYNTIDTKPKSTGGSDGQPPGTVYSGWGGADASSVPPVEHFPERTLKSLTVIAVIVVVCVIVYREYSANSAKHALEQASQIAQKAALERSQAAEIAAGLSIERERRLDVERQIQAQNSKARFELLQRQDAENQQRRTAKEEAWRRFYKPSSICNTGDFVECGNEHARARRAFEANYKD